MPDLGGVAMETFKEYQTVATNIPISLRNNHDRVLLPITGLQQEAGKIGSLFTTVLDSGQAGLTPDQRQELKERTGEVLWCITKLCVESGVTLQEVAEDSARRLQARGAGLDSDRR